MAPPTFPQFDVVSDDISDHHYTTKKPPLTNSKTNKKIMQEWKLLDKNLPESIYVRVYETRTDLLRAAIVGARGTPYHDGLFFFDVHFTSDYPNKPPSVYYKSFGFRVNPNLYADGRVCLSLLNTWNGSKSERWDPARSNILQVLLSIQALVLNEKPYFNEPGFGSFFGGSNWEKKSSTYNENVYILTCKSMLHLLRTPPKHFESLVQGHFNDRASFILTACDGYRKGLVKVGYFNGAVNTTTKLQVSTKFKEVIDKTYRQLVKEFAKTDASVASLVEQVEKEKEQQAIAKKKKETKGSGGVGKSLLMRLKKILFLGRKNNQHKSKNSDVPIYETI